MKSTNFPYSIWVKNKTTICRTTAKEKSRRKAEVFSRAISKLWRLCFQSRRFLFAYLQVYQKYIRALATRPLKDEYGNTYLYVDEDMRLRLETKLIHSVVTGFKVLPV